MNEKDAAINKKDKSTLNDKDFDILSSIWMFSCTDPTPIMAYRAINCRIGSMNENEIRDLVGKFEDLFRIRVSPARLEKWQNDMRQCRNVPSWLNAIKAPSKRKQTIDDFNVHDLFYNQFRSKPDSPPVEEKILNWGLAHIEHWRRHNHELAEEQRKQLNLLAEEKRQESNELAEEKRKTRRELLVGLFPLVVGIAAIISSIFIQQFTMEKQSRMHKELLDTQSRMHSESLNSQKNLKDYEVKLNLKRERYAELMKHIYQSNTFAGKNDSKALTDALNQAQFAYYGLEPLIERDKEEITRKFKEICENCKKTRALPPGSREREKHQQDLDKSKEELREMIYDILFPAAPST